MGETSAWIWSAPKTSSNRNRGKRGIRRNIALQGARGLGEVEREWPRVPPSRPPPPTSVFHESAVDAGGLLHAAGHLWQGPDGGDGSPTTSRLHLRENGAEHRTAPPGQLKVTTAPKSRAREAGDLRDRVSLHRFDVLRRGGELCHIEKRGPRSLPIHSAGYRSRGAHAGDLVESGAPLRDRPAPLLHNGRGGHQQKRGKCLCRRFRIGPTLGCYGHPPPNA